MLFNSYEFLLFFPVVISAYFLLPQRFKEGWLLVASYWFYMGWDPKYGLLLFGATLVTYTGGRLIDGMRGRRLQVLRWPVRAEKLLLFLTIFINFGVLFFFKYFNFALTNLYAVLNIAGVRTAAQKFDIVLPVGISFFTFQAVGYTIDVYRKDIYAEKSFTRYALFVSFFPQLVAGPIERSKNLLKQLDKTYRFQWENMREGLLLMLWGYFLKLMIADRAALYVDKVFGDFYTYTGVYIVMAVILFAFQIYCDFAGYSIIAMGAAKILGIQLMDNFNCPYFSQSVAEFWRRWHISLSSWFRDYLYIPLGGNRKGRTRKHVNILIVFLLSGLWHGASWGFVAWGLINGIYQVIGDRLSGLRARGKELFEIREASFSHKFFKILFTFALIDFSWLFFRAEGFRTSLRIGKQMLIHPNINALLSGSVFTLALGFKDFLVLLTSIIVLICADYLKWKGVVVRRALLNQDFWFRWMVYIFAVLIIVVMGIWGSAYDANSFIYFQF